jgi:tetratricopeptide (TPR) repeat protein
MLLLFFILPAVVVASQSAELDAPAWVLVERAEQAMQAGDIGRAIRLLRSSLEQQSDNPLAQLMLGRAYAKTGIRGDLDVALDYYRRALDNRERFVAPERAILVRYEIASVYKNRRELADYEQELTRIIEEVPLPDDVVLPRDILEAFAAEGLDEMLVLYRIPEDGATRARGMLAELLVGLGRYTEAGELAAIAVLQSLTTIVEAMLDENPLYRFQTVRSLLESARSYPAIDRYIGGTTLFHDLFYLAASYFAEGNKPVAFSLWEFLAETPEANVLGAAAPAGGQWQTRARLRLEQPEREPLLVPLR